MKVETVTKLNPRLKGSTTIQLQQSVGPWKFKTTPDSAPLKKKKKTEIPSLLLMRNILISICCRIIDLKNNVEAKKPHL